MEDERVNGTLSDETIYELLSSKDFELLVSKCKNLGLCMKFEKMKFVGETIQITEEESQKSKKKPQYGKITEIVGVRLRELTVPFFRMQIYAQKEDIHDNQKEFIEGASEFELFPTDSEKWCFCTYLDNPITIMSLRDYENATNPQGKYFSRATYSFKTGKIDPPPTSWEKHCICGMPSNPDRSYIQCDRCKKWMHHGCVNLTRALIDKMATFMCTLCEKKKNTRFKGS